MAIEFSALVGVAEGPYVANPDGILSAYGPGRTGLTLSYYFCDYLPHKGFPNACSNARHDPDHYMRLIIKDGAVEGNGQTAQTVFPVGSTWEIWRKARPGDPASGVKVMSGNLTEPVTYLETPLN